MSRFTILLAGEIEPNARLRAAVAGTRVVAADDGIRHAPPLGLSPELWIGDFDSAPAPPPVQLAGVPRETFPADKDRTDGELAIEAAIGRGASHLLIVGALRGPRTDHAFSNLVLALRYAARGLAVELFDGRERALPLSPEPLALDLAPGTPFSVLKFSDLEGLTIEGAKWPLHDVAVPFLSILTQSNEAAGPVRLSLARGSAILLAQDGPEGGGAPRG